MGKPFATMRFVNCSIASLDHPNEDDRSQRCWAPEVQLESEDGVAIMRLPLTVEQAKEMGLRYGDRITVRVQMEWAR